MNPRPHFRPLRSASFAALLVLGTCAAKADDALAPAPSRGAAPATAMQAADRAATPDFHLSNPPTVPAITPPGGLRPGADGIDPSAMNAEAKEIFEEAAQFDRGDFLPEDKAENWRQFAKDQPAYATWARARAGQWQAFAVKRKAAQEAKQRRLAARDFDWAKLSDLLSKPGIPDTSKELWSSQFVEAYLASPGIEPSTAKRLAPSLPKGASLNAIVELAGSIPPARPSVHAAAPVVPGKAGIQWVRITGGSFRMGTEDADLSFPKPVHEVSVRDFDMAKSPVTFKQYRACVAAGGCTPAHVSDGTCFVYAAGVWTQGDLPKSFQGDAQPVVCVDWAQADAFAKWAGGRLPSEAEWEYAARSGGKEQTYPWGNEAPSCARAVMDEGGDGCGRHSTWPVCSKLEGNTEQGLCDMAGNVWEWLADYGHDSYVGAPNDGSAWVNPAGIDRMKRGGSWRTDAGYLRSAFRGRCDPAHRHDYNGLRPVRSVGP